MSCGVGGFLCCFLFIMYKDRLIDHLPSVSRVSHPSLSATSPSSSSSSSSSPLLLLSSSFPPPSPTFSLSLPLLPLLFIPTHISLQSYQHHLFNMDYHEIYDLMFKKLTPSQMGGTQGAALSKRQANLKQKREDPNYEPIDGYSQVPSTPPSMQPQSEFSPAKSSPAADFSSLSRSETLSRLRCVPESPLTGRGPLSELFAPSAESSPISFYPSSPLSTPIHPATPTPTASAPEPEAMVKGVLEFLESLEVEMKAQTILLRTVMRRMRAQSGRKQVRFQHVGTCKRRHV